MVLKSKPKLSLKFILKRCKTYKIMKGSKNNKGINPSKSYIIKIYCKKYCFWLSYWHIKCKISWERTFKRLYNWDIYRIDSFLLRFSKKVQKEPTELFYKKNCSKNNFLKACNSIKKSTLFTEYLQATAPGSWIWKHFSVVTNLFL